MNPTTHDLVQAHLLREIAIVRTSKSQRGSTLVAVLVILLLITVLGVMAMRQGLSTLTVATNGQIYDLLLLSADAPLNKFMQLNQDSVGYTAMMGAGGVIGSAILNNNPQYEYVFCYRPDSSQIFGSSTNAVVLQRNAGAAPTYISGTNGFCNLTTDFGSNRSAAVTQVAVTIPTDASGLGPMANGNTDPNNGSSTPSTFRVRVTSISMLPAFATSPVATIQAQCLGSGSTPGQMMDNMTSDLSSTASVTDCLASYGIPASSQVQEYLKTNIYTVIQSPVPASQ